MKSVSNKDYNIKEEQKQYKHLEVNLHFKCKLTYFLCTLHKLKKML